MKMEHTGREGGGAGGGGGGAKGSSNSVLEICLFVRIDDLVQKLKCFFRFFFLFL